MSWSDHAIWWHLHPLAFLGAERTALPPGEPPRHRLPALADWLDHLIALGCNGLALGPVFASETHGYDTTDHFRIDPRLGTEKDLTELVERAASRGVRVLLDGVFNHVGRSFGPFADVARHGTASAYADWFVPEGDDFRTFEGHRHLVALNHASPPSPTTSSPSSTTGSTGVSPAGGWTPRTPFPRPSGAPSPTGSGPGIPRPGSAAR